MPTFKQRTDLGCILEQLPNMFVGAELGVQKGLFSFEILRRWRKAREYVMVDLWGELGNYKDIANVAQK